MRSNAAVNGPGPGQRVKQADLGRAMPIGWMPRLKSGRKQDRKGAGTVDQRSRRRLRQGTRE